MPRPVVQAEGVSKSYGGRVLLEDATFHVEPGERVALVGPNGTGKTTILHMVAGRVAPDAGTVALVPRLSVAYFTQHAEWPKNATVRQALASAQEPPAELVAEARELEARMADPALYEGDEANEVVARYGELQQEIARARADAAGGAEENALLEEMGFTEADMERPVASFSGGERTRLLLAMTLSRADPQGFLLLDEPTNHLDVETIEWLEEWLLAYPGAVLLVAHDRAFLDNVATRVLALERGRVASYPGNYSEFERLREEDQQRLLLRREREQKEMERQKAVIEQFKHQKRFNGQMASRLTALSKYRAAIDRTPDPLVEKVQLNVGFPETFKSSHDLIRVRGLGKKWGDRVLFYGLDMDLRKGDRVGLVGANGAGKTTLLRILTGKDKKDVGTIEIAPGVKGAYYAQGSENLGLTNTLRQEVLLARGGLEEADVRALLGRFGFRDEGDPGRKVQTLSGGERARLSLLKTILTPSNLLILDEPTNHLDIESRKALSGALNAYRGTLLVVSHDRWFLDSVIDKVAVLARKQVKVFVGDLTNARTMGSMEEFAVEKPTQYVVKKAFKDYDSGTKHTVGSTLALTPAELEAKRLYRTALSMGWMTEE